MLYGIAYLALLQGHDCHIIIAKRRHGRGATCSYVLAEQWAIHGFPELQDHLHEVPEVSRVVIEDVLMHRDGTIAELSRADPRGATSLADMFVRIQSLAGTKPTRRTLPPFPDPAERTN